MKKMAKSRRSLKKDKEVIKFRFFKCTEHNMQSTGDGNRKCMNRGCNFMDGGGSY